MGHFNDFGGLDVLIWAAIFTALGWGLARLFG